MKSLLALVIATLVGLPAAAQEVGRDAGDPPPAQEPAGPALDIRDAAEVTLEEFLWLKRLLIIFADTERDPSFRKQMEFILERPTDLIERDVVVIVDTDPANPSAVRRKLRPRGFGFVLIGKDGVVALRKPTPWETREIARTIDKMPLRLDEIRARKAAQQQEQEAR